MYWSYIEKRDNIVVVDVSRLEYSRARICFNRSIQRLELVCLFNRIVIIFPF